MKKKKFLKQFRKQKHKKQKRKKYKQRVYAVVMGSFNE